MSVKVEVGKAVDTGLVRRQNEDSILTTELTLSAGDGTSFGLYAVADGMGGLEAGEVASDLALRVLADSVTRGLLLPQAQGELSVLDEAFLSRTLLYALKVANGWVHSQSQAKGIVMGTTLAGALIMNDMAYIFNVGDSRVYLLEGKHLRQVTKDHSLVAELVAAGKITPEDIYTHPQRNIITRCLGTHDSVEVDLFVERLKSGMSLLICSDGLWEMVRDDEMKNTLLKADKPQAACDQLVRKANENGGVDNISVIIVRMRES